MFDQPVPRRLRIRRLVAASTGLVALGLLALPVTTGSAEAAGETVVTASNPVTPGSFTGYGFDQCLAPTQAAMDAWLTSSPFWAVGIYISGNSRHCRNQPNLTPAWVSTQLANGWRLLPITLGPQASCNARYPKYKDDPVISPSTTDNYAAARSQGVNEANTAVAAAQALGIVPGSTLWYDIEAFSISSTTCRVSTLRFLSSWTDQVRTLGYVSGIYSSGASGIRAIDQARLNDAAFSEPDMLWIADWSGTPRKFTGSWVTDGAWEPGGRVHQYRGGHDEVHGGVRINIDSNFLTVGQGSVPGPAPVRCGGIGLDYAKYPRLAEGTTKKAPLQAAQCLLQEKAIYKGKLKGKWNKKTTKAVTAFRSAVGMAAKPILNKKTWLALLSHGAQPLLKYGAASDDVRRLQRALNTTKVKPKLGVSGTFETSTATAVKDYQKARGLDATGVVTAPLWVSLQTGSR